MLLMANNLSSVLFHLLRQGFLVDETVLDELRAAMVTVRQQKSYFLLTQSVFIREFVGVKESSRAIKVATHSDSCVSPFLQTRRSTLVGPLRTRNPPRPSWGPAWHPHGPVSYSKSERTIPPCHFGDNQLCRGSSCQSPLRARWRRA